MIDRDNQHLWGKQGDTFTFPVYNDNGLTTADFLIAYTSTDDKDLKARLKHELVKQHPNFSNDMERLERCSKGLLEEEVKTANYA